ncbi:AAA family ATPase [Clostridium sp. JNZ X4-2]
MNFNEAINTISTVMSKINIDINQEDYDGIIVKRLEASNTLDAGRTTNQTHIAITGDQMDIFPYLRAEGYFSANYGEQDNDLKKFFITQIPVWLSKTNIEYLNDEGNNIGNIFGNSPSKRVVTSIVRSRRRNQTDQIQMSLINMDSPSFVNFRKLLHTGDYLIVLKRKEKLEYEFYGVKQNRVIQGDGGLHELNNQFYKLSTYTAVNIAEVQGEYSTNIERIKGGTNTLLYGVPGSGKSHTIETNYCNDFSLMERVVFHPDYMNTDFVGQILPTVKGEGDEKEITYDFTPGPFTRVLKKAINNPGKHYYLVIEEINRGNAPAIFGEIFQLLDRESDGTSSYKITNHNIASEVFGKKETPIFIPSNLSILATMNTADQNVFTLDTAFQRRWNMKMIENDVTKAEHAKTKILDTTVTWEKFNTVINEQIITSGATTLSSEDKRLGAYFVTKDILKYYSIDEDKDEIVERYGIKSDDIKKVEGVIKDLNSRFGDKVIKYLWDDAFKFSRDDLFESSYKSLEKVLDDFGRFDGNRRFDIFNQDIKDNLFTTEESR